MRIRLSQPPAGDWLAGAWAELGKNHWIVLECKMIVFPKMIMIVLTFYYCQENNHSPVYYYLTQDAVIGGRLLFVPCLSCYSQDCHKTTLYYIILGFCKVNKNKTLAETILLDRSLQKWRQQKNWVEPQKWRRTQNKDYLKNEDNIKNEEDSKNRNDLKNKDDLNKIICPPPT